MEKNKRPTTFLISTSSLEVIIVKDASVPKKKQDY